MGTIRFNQEEEEQLIKNRISSIEAEERPRGSVSGPSRLSGITGPSRKKILTAAGVLAILAVTGVLVYKAVRQQRDGLVSQNRESAGGISSGEMPMESVIRSQFLESDNEHIKRGKQSFLKKYYRDAAAEFNEVVESAATDRDKAIALTYLGIISNETGDYNQAIDFLRRALIYEKDNPDILRYLALAHRRKKDYSEAISLARKALEIRSGDVDSMILLGNIHFEMGAYKEAIGHYETALKAAPENATVLFNLAIALVRTGDEFSAVEYLKRASSIDRMGETALRSLGMLGVIFTERADYQQAEHYLKQAISIRPTNAVNHYNLGIVYIHQGRSEDALKEFTLAEENSPRDSQMLENLGGVYSRLNQYDNSIRVYERLLEENRRNIKILSRMGEIYYKKGELDRAFDIYKQITLIEPAGENARNAYLNMGNILDDAQRFDEAIDAFNRALAINPKDEDAQFNLGIVYQHAGKPEQAIRAWKEASQLNPQNPKPRLAVANYYYENRFYDLAEKEYQDILQIWPDIEEAHFKMGSIYFRQNQLSYAYKAFERVTKINENGDLARKAYVNMGLINADLNSTEKGIDDSINLVQKALLVKPGDPDALMSFGILYARKEMTDRAIDTFYQVIKNTQDSGMIAQAYNNIGKIHFRKKEYRKALQSFTRGLEEDPSSEEIRMNRKAANQAYERELALEK